MIADKDNREKKCKCNKPKLPLKYFPLYIPANLRKKKGLPLFRRPCTCTPDELKQSTMTTKIVKLNDQRHQILPLSKKHIFRRTELTEEKEKL